MAAMAASDTIEAEGHLIDSGLLSAIFDKIIEFKASYEIVKFDVEAESLGFHPVRGRHDPVALYRVTGLKVPASRGP